MIGARVARPSPAQIVLPVHAARSPVEGVLGDVQASRYAVEIGPRHHLDELLEARFRLPSQGAPRAGGIADQQIDLRRTVELGIDPHDHLPRLTVDGARLLGLALPGEVETHGLRGTVDEVADSVRFAGSQYIIIGTILRE